MLANVDHTIRVEYPRGELDGIRDHIKCLVNQRFGRQNIFCRRKVRGKLFIVARVRISREELLRYLRDYIIVVDAEVGLFKLVLARTRSGVSREIRASIDREMVRLSPFPVTEDSVLKTHRNILHVRAIHADDLLLE